MVSASCSLCLRYRLVCLRSSGRSGPVPRLPDDDEGDSLSEDSVPRGSRGNEGGEEGGHGADTPAVSSTN